nr:DUF2214 family protein [Pedobacter panaciterrae]
MSATFYNIALVTHVVGITIMAGTTFIDFVTFRAFYSVFKTDRDKSLVLKNYLYKLQRFLGIGMLLILASGIMMMVKLHEVWGAQLWFRIKMVVLLLIVINGLGLRRMVGSKLKSFLANQAIAKEMDGTIRNFTIVQVIQMLLFLLIYVLSVFKFN